MLPRLHRAPSGVYAFAVVALASLFCRSEPAAANIRVVVAADCPVEQGETSAESAFVDRLGDARFMPRRLRRASDMQTVVAPGLAGPLVAAASISPDTLLIANYKNLVALDIRTGATVELTADLGRLEDRRFIPTGIAIGPKSGKVYLANYLANNILVGRIAAKTVSFDRAIVGDGLVSPENIAISTDESWLATANFDGNSATGFAFEDGQFTQKWATKVPLAHGVAILGDHVFVSSLELRKILILRLATGEVVGSFGGPGWNAHCLNFLWPTGIHAVGDKTIVITDAHTGGVYRVAFDGESVKLLEVVGGTAPGATGLQMPYGATSIGDDLALLSTFSPKIVIAGAERGAGASVSKKLIVQQSYQAAAGSDSAMPAALGTGWNGYVHLAAARLTISGVEMVPSYGALEGVTTSGPLKVDHVFSLNPDTLALFGSLMYFIEARIIGNGAILSSPSAPYAFYVTLGETSCMAKLDLPGPPLATPAGLEHRLGVSRYEELAEIGATRLREIDARRGSRGFLSLAEAGRSLGNGHEAAELVARTDWGKQAGEQLSKCADGEYQAEQCDRLANELKRQALSGGASSLIGLLLIDISAHRCAPQI